MDSEWTRNNYPVVSYFRLPKSNPRFSLSRLIPFPRYTSDSQSRVTLNRCIHSNLLPSFSAKNPKQPTPVAGRGEGIDE